jgi:predicted nuclease with TOPRIM domain
VKEKQFSEELNRVNGENVRLKWKEKQFNGENVKLKGKEKQFSEELNRVNGENVKLKGKEKQFSEELNRVNGENVRLKVKEKQFSEELDRVNGENEKLKGVKQEYEKLTEEHTRLQGENEKLKRFKGDNEELTGELQQLQGDNENLKRFDGDDEKIKQLGEEIEKLKRVNGENEQLTRDFQQLMGCFQQLTGDLQQLQAENQQLTGDFQQLKGENQQLKSQLAQRRADSARGTPPVTSSTSGNHEGCADSSNSKARPIRVVVFGLRPEIVENDIRFFFKDFEVYVKHLKETSVGLKRTDTCYSGAITIQRSRHKQLSAFVVLPSTDEAERAVRLLHRTRLFGNFVSVRHDTKPDTNHGTKHGAEHDTNQAPPSTAQGEGEDSRPLKRPRNSSPLRPHQYERIPQGPDQTHARYPRCGPCHKEKMACDSGAPGCSNCVRRGKQCWYQKCWNVEDEGCQNKGCTRLHGDQCGNRKELREIVEWNVQK